MSPETVVALLSFLGTLLGTGGGILASAKLTNFRLQQLEKKVDKYDKFAERIPVIEEQQKVQDHRIADLEKNAS